MKTYCLAMTVIWASFLFVVVPAFASGTDDSIKATAEQSYVFKTYLKSDDITVHSKDGLVTLTGTVSEGFHETLAQEYFKSLPGVKSVDNNLIEKGEVPAKYSNAWLIAKVKDALLFHRDLQAVKIEVLAKNGTITLHGNASCQAQKDLITQYATDVGGVKLVKNKMKTPGTEITSAGTTMGEKMDAVNGTIDDASVTAMVKSVLLYQRSTSALRATVKTKNGVVELGGIARNKAEKKLVSKLVSDVYGVRKVVNHMTYRAWLNGRWGFPLFELTSWDWGKP